MRGDPTPPSVLVTLTRLKEGSLPQVVIGYGTVGRPRAQDHHGARGGRRGRDRRAPGRAGSAGAPLIPGAEPGHGGLLHAGQVGARRRAAPRGEHAQARGGASRDRAAARRCREVRVRRPRALQALEGGRRGPQVVRAPFRAIVTTLSATPGAIVAEGAPLLDLAAPRRLVLTVGVVPAQAGEISADDTATVTLVGGTAIRHRPRCCCAARSPTEPGSCRSSRAARRRASSPARWRRRRSRPGRCAVTSCRTRRSSSTTAARPTSCRRSMARRTRCRCRSWLPHGDQDVIGHARCPRAARARRQLSARGRHEGPAGRSAGTARARK